MDKKYLRQIALSVLSTVLSVGLILYIGYHLFYGLTQKVVTVPATISEAASSVTADAYFFRAETVLRSKVNHTSHIPVVSDGTRIGVGTVVSRCYDVAAPDIVSQIAALTERIDILENMLDSTLTIRDTVSLDNDVYSVMHQIAAIGQSGVCGGISTLRTNLLIRWNQRMILIDTTTDISAAIAALRQEKNTLTAQLGVCREETVASVSGYYYAECDGYESVFTAERALTMTPEEFLSLTHTQATEDTTAVGKISRSYQWYLSVMIPAEREADFSPGISYTVSFPYNGGKNLDMQLERMELSSDGLMLVFSSGSLPENFTFSRVQPVQISYRNFEGIRLPVSALRAVDGINGVYILTGSIVHYRAVEILYEEDDFCIVRADYENDPPEGYQWLRCNDIVITKGRGLHEGRVLS